MSISVPPPVAPYKELSSKCSKCGNHPDYHISCKIAYCSFNCAQRPNGLEHLHVTCGCCGYVRYLHTADYVELKVLPAHTTYEQQAEREVEELLQ